MERSVLNGISTSSPTGIKNPEEEKAERARVGSGGGHQQNKALYVNMIGRHVNSQRRGGTEPARVCIRQGLRAERSGYMSLHLTEKQPMIDDHLQMKFSFHQRA